jgi:hypothetical protein
MSERIRNGTIYSAEELEIHRKCDAYIKKFQANPPGVKGWLKGGVDKARMLKLKEQIENES